MLPSQVPEFEPYPSVHSFVKSHFDMQFDDVRAIVNQTNLCEARTLRRPSKNNLALHWLKNVAPEIESFPDT